MTTARDLTLVPSANNPSSATVDVVFVHGLAGDPIATWQRDSADPATYWPDWVVQDITNVAVWNLGYPADNFGGANANAMALEDRAKSAIEYLRSSGLGKRPLIFVAHSLGGLLVKQLLRTGYDEVDKQWLAFAQAVRGVIFLATPHTGSDLAKVARTLRDLQCSTRFAPE
jgi:triacylglycerol esterase/lipase EstA (alpha/beta hydrolase family)